jgi:surface antigen
MFRPLLLAASLLAIPVAVSIPAPGDSAGATQSRTGEDCRQRRDTRRQRGRGIGGFLGSAIGGRLGGAAGLVNNLLPVGELLGDAIASMLDCDEQQKAASATEEAVRGGVGTSASWESTTRSGVTGSSTVIAADSNTVEGECMTVTDIVIIDGEETRAPKRMCRRPPNNRYVRV